ncbi:hypothetical protein [Flexivirga oryzae]|uniref:Uncharacterized protein n=1 Tax=Flexivirga oryzae TaxID=1794944 RepID=A0A839NIP2_9MICO|nr:hypothetical protein [Flexivirga oryzae]MBB2892628.1 hypothetical protein [Flexivirga oryzae]MBB2894521.1 hypothetical protein [Flexivirga oryzae]
MNTHELRWWRRRPALWVALLLVVAVALSTVLFVRHQGDKGRMAAGTSRPGDYAVSDTSLYRTFQLVVPGASVMINAEVGQRAALVDDKTYDVTRVKAPHGGQLVHLEWSVSGPWLGGAPHTGDHTSSLAVRSRTTSVVLDRAITAPVVGSAGSGDDDRHEALVAVPGELADLQVTVTFQGRTQSISLASGERRLGAFASLYRPRAAGAQVSLTRDQPTDGQSPYRWFCHAEVNGLTRTPYVDALGWAPAGHEWVVVSGAGVRASDRPAEWIEGGRLAGYERDGKPQVTVTVNGEHPETSVSAAQPTKDRLLTARDYVFSIHTGDAATVEVEAVVPAKRGKGEDRHAPARTTVRVGKTLSAPAVVDPAPRVSR